MKKTIGPKFSVFLNIVLILFLIGYFWVPFLTISWLTKIFSRICFVSNAFQGEGYLTPWCKEVLTTKVPAKNGNINKNEDFNNEPTNFNKNSNQNINANSQIANPAAIKCLEDGGLLENYIKAGREAALCIFKDQSICEEWEYYRGECQKGECFKKCEAIGTRSEGWYNSCTSELIKYDKCGPEKAEPDIVKEIENIIVNLPAVYSELSSPFEVSGRARVADSKVYIRVKNKEGKTLIESSTNVKNIGTDGFGDFKINITYEFSTTKEGFVEVYSINPKTQTEENLVSIPVKF